MADAPANLAKKKNGCLPYKHILIVEDEPMIRDTLRSLLEMEGFVVYTAINGLDGLRLLHEVPHPCLILLDLMMPVMNGQEFLAAKKLDDAIASIPVCVVSGAADAGNVSGVSGFVRKPFEMGALLKFIRCYCQSKLGAQ